MAAARLHFVLYYDGKGLIQPKYLTADRKVKFMSWGSFYFGRGAVGGSVERT